MTGQREAHLMGVRTWAPAKMVADDEAFAGESHDVRLFGHHAQ
ncbi:hypothetical protein NZL82_18490 [Sphingomonas sanguinis]|nr:hypothetical protein [Sphingomonas sp. LC-1]MCT8003864.1 hypothetical protein [Sphingomonas sp. LC-1]